MHLPTYIFLMFCAMASGIYKSFVLWQTNWLLFAVAVLVTLATAFGGVLQSLNESDFEFKWMLVFTVPLFLLIASSYLQITEMSDSILSKVGIEPPSHIIPGSSKDYANAIVGHYLAMLFPAGAWLVAKLVQLGMNRWSRGRDA